MDTRAQAIDQIGFLVDDLDAAIARWIRQFGVGPWTVFRNVVLDGHYRGAPTRVGMDVALGYQGDMQIELIAVTDEAASPYRAADGRRLRGLHHIAHIVDDLDLAVRDAQARGLVVVFTASNPSTRVAYLSTPDEPETLFEFIQGEGMREMWEAGVAEARAWDGQEPVRTIDLAS
ncbi:VOC family protein [Novosphingobium aquimarinum]|uniref:VOC family protein n=1 Tax=Novosphingobium aquimarinum TaxID=2682494 RepID=UPI0012EBE200|nr:VOC family protein [Novosphingobium aquimarinum]